MQKNVKPSRKEELRAAFIVLIPITLIALVADVTYKGIGGMFSGADAWIGVIWAACHFIMMLGWYVVVVHWQDPHRDLFRAMVFLAALFAAAFTIGHRAGWFV